MQKHTPNVLHNLLQRAINTHRAGHLDEAATLYRSILEKAPNTASALTNLGSILRQQGRIHEAIDLLERAITLSDSNEHAAYNLGNAFRAAGRYSEAYGAFCLAAERNPAWALSHCNRGVTLVDMGLQDEGAKALRHALSLDSHLELARVNLAKLISSQLMTQQYRPVADEMTLLHLAREYGSICPSSADIAVRHREGKPLLTGFLSPDLCDHPVGLYLRPILRHLDRQRVQPILYSTGGREDSTRIAMRQLCGMVDVSGYDDPGLLKRLREDNLDILIDLSGHTAGHRLPVFAARAAPVQISWLGYFATTGVSAMDAVLMDEWHVPEGYENQFTEQVVRLPYNRFCYQPAPFAPAITPAPSLTKGSICFGSFNNTLKYHDGVFDLWARILSAVPHSRLVLKWRTFEDAVECDRTHWEFARRNITPERIELRPFSFHGDLLKEYADIDIALDPFPFTGGHTSCEALWMGVPVITWPQTRAVSRQTYAFLATIGLTELAAKDADDYLSIAFTLANDPQHLSGLRETLRSRMQVSPLCDVAGFAHAFENTLLSLYRDRCATSHTKGTA